jgi:hypothetical protein
MNFGKEKPNTKSSENLENKNIFVDTGRNMYVLKEKLDSIDEDKLSPEQKSAFLKVKEKIFNVSKKFIRTAEWITIITGVLHFANYERTHSELEKKINEKGEITYSHEDQRTTHLLNILAGKEKFNESDFMSDIRPLISFFCDKYNLSLPKNIGEMSIDEIDKFIFDNQDLINSKVGEKRLPFERGDFKKQMFNELRALNIPNDTTESTPNKNLYDLVWTLEEECGNPRVRFNEENIGFSPFKDFKGVSHYDPINNIVYINMYDLTAGDNKYGTFFPEMSHADQFNKNQIASYLNACGDFLSVFKKAGFNSNKISLEYGKLYNKPGSIEHEAHKLIEPYLKNKYQLFIKKDMPIKNKNNITRNK